MIKGKRSQQNILPTPMGNFAPLMGEILLLLVVIKALISMEFHILMSAQKEMKTQ